MTRTGAALVLLVGIFAACDDGPKPTAEPAAPPAAQVQFPASATHATYWWYDDAGQRRVVREREDVPFAARTLVGVNVGEKTPSVEGQVYIVDLSATPGRVATANLTDEEDVKRQAIAAWSGADLALVVGESATIYSEIGSEVAAVPVSKSAKKKKGKKSRADAPVRTIEIVSISGDDGGWDAPKPKVRTNVAMWGWKDVTMYSTKSCGVCNRARRWLKANRVSFREYDVNQDRYARRRMYVAARNAGFSGGGVPTFVIGKERRVMQGWDEGQFIELAKR